MDLNMICVEEEQRGKEERTPSGKPSLLLSRREKQGRRRSGAEAAHPLRRRGLLCQAHCRRRAPRAARELSSPSTEAPLAHGPRAEPRGGTTWTGHPPNQLGDTGRGGGAHGNFKRLHGNLLQHSSRPRRPSPPAGRGAAGQPGVRGAGGPGAAARGHRVCARPRGPASAALRPPLRPGPGPGAPHAGPLPRSPRQPAARQAASLTCASRPGPAGRPPPQPPLHRLRRRTAAPERTGESSGHRRLRQEAQPLTRWMRLLASRGGPAPCCSFAPIGNSPGRRLRPLLPGRASFGSDGQARGVELK
ncbi:translation initiation factor IF-2-like [Vulpes lagopus]|uniref:translation initiation factor IF-2-like n=1 Tax=Vulpes lagopus TaxID=494514 RepID=UPI001BCA0BF3|nr:translation initiation factor IF-2-like [Vulpes lagopus]